MTDEPQQLRSFEQTEAFVQLFTLNQRRIYLFILSLVAHPADAEEILQETNLILWRKFDQFQASSDFRAWAFQIAHFEVLKFRQRVQRRPNLFPLSDGLVDRLAEVAVSETEHLERRRSALVNCLQKLSPRDRDLVERRARSGVTITDIAGEVRRPRGGLYKSFERIYRALHACIDRTLAEEAD